MQQLAHQAASAASSAERLHGADGLHEQDVDVKAILSDPRLEGDPLQFLKVTEAYWTVRDPLCRAPASAPFPGVIPSRPSCTVSALSAAKTAAPAHCQVGGHGA